MENTFLKAPTNEEFVIMVKDYYERFPSMCSSLFAMGVIIAGYYREKNTNVDEQFNYFVINTD